MNYLDILKHPWLNGTATTKQIPDIQKKIKEFKASKVFKVGYTAIKFINNLVGQKK